MGRLSVKKKAEMSLRKTAVFRDTRKCPWQSLTKTAPCPGTYRIFFVTPRMAKLDQSSAYAQLAYFCCSPKACF